MVVVWAAEVAADGEGGRHLQLLQVPEKEGPAQSWGLRAQLDGAWEDLLADPLTRWRAFPTGAAPPSEQGRPPWAEGPVAQPKRSPDSCSLNPRLSSCAPLFQHQMLPEGVLWSDLEVKGLKREAVSLGPSGTGTGTTAPPAERRRQRPAWQARPGRGGGGGRNAKRIPVVRLLHGLVHVQVLIHGMF